MKPTSPSSPADKRAERDAAQQDVFLREVDEALRQDQVAGLFRRYGVPALAVIAIGLAGLGGYLWWDHSHKAGIEQRSENFVVALDKLEGGQLDTADKQLAPIAAESGGGAVAAKLLRAGIALQDKRRDEAVRLFGEVAADDAAPRPLRDLALLRKVAASFDAMPPEKVVAELSPLAAPGNPWFGVAGELVGIAYLKQNKPELAGPLFGKIAKDKDAPDSLRRRARQMAGLLGVDAIDDIARPVGADGEPDGETGQP